MKKESLIKFAGDLIAGADHEINNLVMMIEGSAHILLSENPSPEAKNMALEAISEKTHKVKEVMDDLRKVMSTGEKDDLKDNYVKDLTSKAISLCKTRFKNHRIFFSVNIDEFSAIQCKETKLVQAILAVLTHSHENIIKQKEKWVKVKVFDFDEELMIDIEDSGGNYLEGYLDLVTNENNEEFNIGLSWAKEIVEEHKGNIKMINGEHPVTRITLPRMQKQAGSNKVCEEISMWEDKKAA